MPNRRTPDRPWTAEEARAVLDDWRRSGDTLTVFARRRGTSTQRIAWWRKRFTTTTSTPTSLSLVPARIVTTASNSPRALIRLPNGIEIEAEHGSPSWIATVVVELTKALS